jgi:hypothetical protein
VVNLKLREVNINDYRRRRKGEKLLLNSFVSLHKLIYYFVLKFWRVFFLNRDIWFVYNGILRTLLVFSANVISDKYILLMALMETS